MTEPRQTLLVLGGSSDIARATALAYAQAGWAIQLAGRNPEALARDAADITTRSAMPVTTHAFDVLDTAGHTGFIDALPVLPDAVICAIGVLGDQRTNETDTEAATCVMRSNFEGPALILGAFAARFEARGKGDLIGISSVAGERGRASNYVYGAAKAGFTAFLSGLRNRCFKAGVHVMTVNPGFVRTRMTAGMPLPAPLTAEPAQVGAAILAAHAKRRNVLYVLPVWWVVMSIIKALPEALFKRMKI
jgi:decaprenylphospho-beta-D-erythro-pentofuranosid-2-ulose 2-reductase